MIPLYSFLEGDTMGLLMLASDDETVDALAARAEASAGCRVAPRGGLQVRWRGQLLDGRATVAATGLEPLDRIDVVRAEAVKA
jgi:Toluene-4-monooxygenase system protein B (TmoB)